MGYTDQITGIQISQQLIDLPFLPPATQIIMINLPRPPSLNHIWKYGRKGVRPSPVYEAWKKHADALSMAQRIHHGRKPIKGPFEATVLVANGGRGDLDNLAKGPLDWAQSRRLIINDKHCRKLTIEFVEKHRAREGCRLILTELAS